MNNASARYTDLGFILFFVIFDLADPAAYNNALGIDPDYVPGKVSLGALLRRTGGKSLPVARSILTDALRLDPTNHKAWYNLGMVHKLAGRAAEAADCFQTAFVLEQSAPIEKFSSLS